MVLVRSPKRGPWLCPASPSRAAAAAGEAGESAKGAERGQAMGTRLTAAAPAGSEGSSFFAAAAETKRAAVVEAAGAASPSAAVAGREQAERGACFASSSPRCPARSASRLSPVSRRKSTSCVGFFSEAATHSSSGACRRPSPPAASSSETRTAAACEARTDVAAEARGAAAEVRGATAAAARETTSGTHAALPFSRSAARRLARIPSHAAAAPGAGAAADTAAAAGPAIRAEGGGSARRGPSLRHFSRAPATTGEACTNSKNESLQPQPTHATAAVSNVSVPKRMRYAQRSPLRGTSGRAETQRSTMESRGMVASFPLPRKPSTTAPAARAAAAAECQSPVHRTAAAASAAASCSPREDVSAAATPAPRVESALPAAGKGVSAAAAIVPSEATTSSSTAAPTAAAELLDTQQHPLQQHSVQAVELLQQLPATRALHEYVQEATRSEILRRHHGERAEATPAAADDLGSGAAVASLAAPGTAAAAATHAAPTAARSAVAKPPATGAAAAATAATASAAADAARAPRSVAASSGGSAAAGPTSSAVAAAAAVQIPALAAAAVGVPPNAAVASAAPASPVATGVCVRTPPLGSAAGSAVTPASWTGYSGDKLQQLVLPRTAEDLRREWSPTVDNVIQRLCDIREEEKQVTQFIMLEGRALRVLRHVTKALQKKRTEVAAVHATAAQQEAEQQQAHAESEKHFDIVHRQAEDAAGGQAHLERRLKDTQQKKERLLQLRRQLYEEMFACALLRQKKVELAKQLVSLKSTSAARETRRNALYQLLQRITRLRLLYSPHGHVLRAAVIPEGDNQTLQQFEEEEDLLPPAEPEDERELLLQQQQRERHEEDEVQVQQQQRLHSVGAGEQQRRGREETIDDGQHLQEKSRTHVEQQVERERLGGHHHGFGETRQQTQKTFAPVAAGDSRSHQRNALQIQLPQQRGIGVEENAATEYSALPVKFSAGLPMDGSMAARDRETLASGDTDPDVFSLCTEPSIDGDDSCRRLIAAKKPGEPALVTVDCRRRDSKSGVCRDVDALWRIIEDAIGLSFE